MPRLSIFDGGGVGACHLSGETGPSSGKTASSRACSLR